jgi:dTMP kinase
VAVGRGLFISLEGGEGSGKTAQAHSIVAHLKGAGLAVQLVREPGGTNLAERIRDLLLFARDVSLSAEAQALLFSAARAQLTNEVIQPALKSGTHIVADRFFDSTFAYQGYGMGADLDGLRATTTFAVHGLVPDLTFLLDIPAEEGLSRRRSVSDRWDRFEMDDIAFHRRVREGYLELARLEPERFVVVDARSTEADVAAIITAKVDDLVRRRSSKITAAR